MKVYQIEALGCYMDKHCVLADSYETAVALWKKEYKSEPISIKMISKYVIIQKD